MLLHTINSFILSQKGRLFIAFYSYYPGKAPIFSVDCGMSYVVRLSHLCSEENSPCDVISVMNNITAKLTEAACISTV